MFRLKRDVHAFERVPEPNDQAAMATGYSSGELAVP